MYLKELLITQLLENIQQRIIPLSYYKPTRKAWNTGKAEGNKATSYFFKQQPNQRFELVKDIEPNNYSVHFKTDRNGLSYGNKMQLFAKEYLKVLISLLGVLYLKEVFMV